MVLAWLRHSETVRTLFFFNDTATTEIYTLSLHDALPISAVSTVTGRPWRSVEVTHRSIWLAYGEMAASSTAARGFVRLTVSRAFSRRYSIRWPDRTDSGGFCRRRGGTPAAAPS